LFIDGALIARVFVLFKGLALERLPWPRTAIRNIKRSFIKLFGEERAYLLCILDFF